MLEVVSVYLIKKLWSCVVECCQEHGVLMIETACHLA